METLTSPLVERVQAFVQRDTPVEWGSPLLSTEPAAPTVQQLADLLAGAERALRESALQVQRMAKGVQELSAQVAAATTANDRLNDDLRAMFSEAIARKFRLPEVGENDAGAVDG